MYSVLLQINGDIERDGIEQTQTPVQTKKKKKHATEACFKKPES